MGSSGKKSHERRKKGSTGTDNVRLQAILKDAKRMSVPADLIERNLKKASEAKGGDFMELTYEGVMDTAASASSWKCCRIT